MRTLDKDEALKMLERFDKEEIELRDQRRNAANLIYCISEEMFEADDFKHMDLWNAISVIARALFEDYIQ